MRRLVTLILRGAGSFAGLAAWTSRAAGSPWAFAGAAAVVLAWLGAGFFIGFTDTFFQLIINTFTTIVTFLMVFLLQATQNRDTKAIHRKLDELILAAARAQNSMIGLELKTEVEIDLEADRQRRAAGDSALHGQ